MPAPDPLTPRQAHREVYYGSLMAFHAWCVENKRDFRDALIDAMRRYQRCPGFHPRPSQQAALDDARAANAEAVDGANRTTRRRNLRNHTRPPRPLPPTANAAPDP